MRKMILLLFIFACNTADKSAQSEQNEQTEQKHVRVSLEEFKEIIKDPEVQLVDVRTPEEYAGGYIDEAANIDFRSPNFINDCQEKLDKSKKTAIYCAGGGRSAKALIMLKEAGFTEVYELGVGYSGYE